MKFLPFLFSLFFSTIGISQNFHLLDIPVFKNGKQLTNPWVGGMNAPQWSAVDLNRDGIKDLYAFDRNGNVHLGFINQNNNAGFAEYKFVRYWMDKFPRSSNFVLLRDFDNNTAVDLINSSFDEFSDFYNQFIPGLKVYKGYYNEFNQLEFERKLFSETDNLIPFHLNGNLVDPINTIISTDYPAVDDINGDGDLDILAMNEVGSKVLYFENKSIEKGLPADSLFFELEDDCWGKFGLTAFSPKLTLSSESNNCAFFRDNEDEEDRVHGGTTMCTFDNNNDGDKEILYGDLIFPTIILGENGGSANNAWINAQDTMFPSYDLPVDIPDFPASFYLDVNNDGARDLLFSPNSAYSSPDVETVWWYKNIGTDATPSFEYQQSDFMTEGVIDFGTGANPVFVDVNADGLLDIVVGNREKWEPDGFSSSLSLLLNSGSESDPVFELVNEDWLGLSAFNAASRSFAPTFGDLDNDGDQDLLVGDRQGFIHFWENTAGEGEPMEFADPVFQWQSINVGSYSTPFIFDINKDELPDLIIGERNGNVNYFPNIGTQTMPEFHPEESESPNNEFFGKISTITGGSVIGFSQPFVIEFGDELNIFCGSNEGWVSQYSINPDSLESGAFSIIDERLGNLREGNVTRVFMANINASNYLDAIIGNDRGGISVFQSPITIDGLVNNTEIIQQEITAYPNPATDHLIIEWGSGLQNVNTLKFQLINSVGIVVTSGEINRGENINVDDISRGVYFLKLNGVEFSPIKIIVQ